jgi:hypothetical protein
MNSKAALVKRVAIKSHRTAVVFFAAPAAGIAEASELIGNIFFPRQ